MPNRNPDGSLDVLVVGQVMTDLIASGGRSTDDYAKLPKGNLDVTGPLFHLDDESRAATSRRVHREDPAARTNHLHNSVHNRGQILDGDSRSESTHHGDPTPIPHHRGLTPEMKTILVVDDEPSIAQIAGDYLRHGGFRRDHRRRTASTRWRSRARGGRTWSCSTSACRASMASTWPERCGARATCRSSC